MKVCEALMLNVGAATVEAHRIGRLRGSCTFCLLPNRAKILRIFTRTLVRLVFGWNYFLSWAAPEHTFEHCSSEKGLF